MHPSLAGPLIAATSDIVNLVTGLAWPVLVAIVIVLLLPGIRSVISSRGFTVKAGGMEITVQQASDQLATGVDDLRNRVISLERATAGASVSGGPTASEPGGLDETAGVPTAAGQE